MGHFQVSRRSDMSNRNGVADFEASEAEKESIPEDKCCF